MRLRAWLVAGIVLAGSAHAQDPGIETSLADLCASRENADEAYARLEAAGPSAFGSVLQSLLAAPSDAAKRRLASLLAGYARSMESTEPHLEDVRKLLSQKDPEVLAIAWPVLAKAGPPIVPALERLFAAPEADVRSAAARALGASGRALPILRKNLESASAYRVEASLLGIAEAGDAASEFEVAAERLLADKRDDVRAAAVEAYGSSARDRRKAARTLIAMLDDSNPRVAAAAVKVLRSQASERLPEVVAAVPAAGPERGARLAEILRGLPTDAAATYGAELTAAPPGTRNVMLEALSPAMTAALPAPARDAIVRWTRDADVATRLAAIAVVGSGGWPDRPEAVRLLREAAVAPQATVRALAVHRLGDLDDTPEVLRAACADPDPVVRMEAACAIFRSGERGPDPLPLCVALLDRVPEAATRIAEMGGCASSAIPALLRNADSPLCGAASRDALARLLASAPADVVSGRTRALATAPEALRASAARALQWLAGAQETDGRWEGDRWGGAPGCETGLTGLALLALLSAGETEASDVHGGVVRKAVEYLLAAQREDGVIGSRATSTFLIQHGIAAAALAEAACVSRDRRVRRAAESALKFIVSARNPELGWRYEPRGRENDTFVTTWMVVALKAGECAGLPAGREAYDGALRWIDRMTDPTFGHIGYDSPGSAPASPTAPGSVQTLVPLGLVPLGAFPSREEREIHERKRAKLREAGFRELDDSAACTAAGLWVRFLAGSDLAADVERQCVGFLADVPPTWDEKAFLVDECYWHWGALVAAQRPKTAPRPFAHGQERPADLVGWRERLEREILAHQAEDGSWEPVGVWGRTGGRVFSTATATLALLAPYAYPEGCFGKDYRRELYPDAYKLLGR